MPAVIAVPSYIFRPEVEAALRLIAQTERPDVSDAVAQFVASLVHPDFVCNLSSVCMLDGQAKSVALDLFAYCLATGLSADEKGALSAWLMPILERATGHPSSRG